MSRIRRRDAVSVLFATPVLAQNQNGAQNESDGLRNGHAWNEFSRNSREAYMLAVNDCALLFDHLERLKSGKTTHSSKGFVMGDEINSDDLMSEISKFYANPANALIPIVIIYDCSMQVLGGISREYIDINILPKLRPKWGIEGKR
jgi:hypothetical protein